MLTSQGWKRTFFRCARLLGAAGLAFDSSWRRRRLLILCYHSVALADEHAWRPNAYIRPETLVRRLELLRENRCAILPLSEAVRRLYEDDLPPRSVAVTFDDGTYDFYRFVLPAVKSLGMPVTVYISTYYSQFNRPVFDPALSYLLWKAEGRTLDWPEVLGAPVALNERTREQVRSAAFDYCAAHDLDGSGKDELLASLAGRTGLNYKNFCAARMFTLMKPAELAEAAAAGVAVELHTHRHRLYRNKTMLLRELDENRAALEAATGVRAKHFCYPCGCSLPEFVPWLKDWGMLSAVTCQPGLASRRCDPMLLPRLVDRERIAEIEFEAWLSGIAALLPIRNQAIDTWPLRRYAGAGGSAPA